MMNCGGAPEILVEERAENVSTIKQITKTSIYLFNKITIKNGVDIQQLIYFIFYRNTMF